MKVLRTPKESLSAAPPPPPPRLSFLPLSDFTPSLLHSGHQCGSGAWVGLCAGPRPVGGGDASLDPSDQNWRAKPGVRGQFPEAASELFLEVQGGQVARGWWRSRSRGVSAAVAAWGAYGGGAAWVSPAPRRAGRPRAPRPAPASRPRT